MPAGYAVRVAAGAKFTIRVRAARGSVTVAYSSNGRYISLPVNTVSNPGFQAPVQTAATPTAFWLAIMDLVETNLGGEA